MSELLSTSNKVHHVTAVKLLALFVVFTLGVQLGYSLWIFHSGYPRQAGIVVVRSQKDVKVGARAV